MVLVLKNDQMENLLPMPEEIDAIEQAFRELGQGKAMNAPRARLRTPWKEEGGQYYFNNIMGLVPGVKSMALRIDSSFSKEVQVAGSKRRVYRSGHALRHGHLRYPGADGRSFHLDPQSRCDERRGQQVSRARGRQSHGPAWLRRTSQNSSQCARSGATAEKGQSVQPDKRKPRALR